MFFRNRSFLQNSTRQEPNEVESSRDGRNVPKNTYTEGLVNNMRCTLGSGILAMPIAFKEAGYVGAIIGIVVITFMSNYCAITLVKCQRELLKRNKDMITTYQGTVRAAFSEGPESLRYLAPLFVVLTNFFILLDVVGGVCVDLVFISSNIKAAINLETDIRYFEVLVFIPIFALSLVPNMKKLSIVSSFGIFIIVLNTCVIFYFILRDPISLEGRHAFGTFNDLPKFMGTIFFCSVTVSIVLPLEKEMVRPGMLEGPFGVLSTSAILCSIFYIFLGLFGYLKYGDYTKDSVTLNLPSANWLSQAVQLLISVSSFTSSAMALYIGVTVIWSDYLDRRLTRHRLLAQYLVRISFVILILMISLLVPELQLLISTSGILSQCTLSTTLPCIINVLTNYQQDSIWDYARKFWIDALTFIFTMFALVTFFVATFK